MSPRPRPRFLIASSPPAARVSGGRFYPEPTIAHPHDPPRSLVTGCILHAAGGSRSGWRSSLTQADCCRSIAWIWQPQAPESRARFLCRAWSSWRVLTNFSDRLFNTASPVPRLLCPQFLSSSPFDRDVFRYFHRAGVFSTGPARVCHRNSGSAPFIASISPGDRPG